MKQMAGVLITPTVTFREIAQQKPWAKAILIIVLVAVIRALVTIPDERTLKLLPLDLGSPLVFTLAILPFLILVGLLFWLFFSLLTYGVAKLFGGKGTFSSTLLVLAYSELPFVLLVLVLPLAILHLYPMPAEILSLSGLFINLFQLALVAWSILLIIVGLKEVHFFGYLQSTGAACLPSCGCLLLIFLFVGLLITLGLISTANLLGQ